MGPVRGLVLRKRRATFGNWPESQLISVACGHELASCDTSSPAASGQNPLVSLLRSEGFLRAAAFYQHFAPTVQLVVREAFSAKESSLQTAHSHRENHLWDRT
jgi:hypothetical protein